MKLFWLILAAVLFGLAARWRSIGRAGRIAAFAVGVVFVLVGTSVIELPSIETIVREIGGRLGKWTYLLVGVNAFLETGAFLGFVAPGETMVLFGGVLAGEGTIDLVPLIAVVWVSAMLGDVSSYVIGRRYGRDVLLRYGARVKIGEAQVLFVERFFERHGDLTVLFGRWVGVVRPLVPFLAGSSRVPFARFAAVDLVSTFIWSAALCILGSVFWQNFEQLTSLVGRTLFGLGTILVIVALVGLAIATRRSVRRSAAVERWLAVQLHEHAVVGRPAAAVWALITRIEPQFPGRKAQRGPTGGAATVQGDAPGPRGPGPSDSTPH